jgi:GNAT superfamily N-acetyltransferase
MLSRARKEGDLERAVGVLLAYRLATSVRVYPTLWRLRLLWASRVWEPERDLRIWQDGDGRMAAFALLWRRRPDNPNLVLDRFVHPAGVTGDLARATLEWGVGRAAGMAAENEMPLALFANALDPGVYAGTDLADAGFHPEEVAPGDQNAYLYRSLAAELPAPVLPAGHAIRPVAGAEELAGYDELYGFAAVSPEHRRMALASSEYEHLVVVDPEGALAAYCECSVSRAEWQGGSERLGWIDYAGTRPERRREGLGKAAMLAGLACLRDWGAEGAMLATVSGNRPAMALYAAAGFERVDVGQHPYWRKGIPAVLRKGQSFSSRCAPREVG